MEGSGKKRRRSPKYRSKKQKSTKTRKTPKQVDYDILPNFYGLTAHGSELEGEINLKPNEYIVIYNHPGEPLYLYPLSDRAYWLNVVKQVDYEPMNLEDPDEVRQIYQTILRSFLKEYSLFVPKSDFGIYTGNPEDVQGFQGIDLLFNRAPELKLNFFDKTNEPPVRMNLVEIPSNVYGVSGDDIYEMTYNDVLWNDDFLETLNQRLYFNIDPETGFTYDSETVLFAPPPTFKGKKNVMLSEVIQHIRKETKGEGFILLVRACRTGDCPLQRYGVPLNLYMYFIDFRERVDNVDVFTKDVKRELYRLFNTFAVAFIENIEEIIKLFPDEIDNLYNTQVKDQINFMKELLNVQQRIKTLEI